VEIARLLLNVMRIDIILERLDEMGHIEAEHER
jgi:hypothetical protein